MGSDASALVRRFYDYTGSPPTGPDLIAMMTSIRGTIAALMVNAMDADTFFTDLVAIDLSSDYGASGASTGISAGTRAGTPLGASSSVLVSFPIGRRYRGGHPRSYWPWGTSDDLDTRNYWASSPIGFFQTTDSEIDAAIAGATSGGCTLGGHVNVSYYQGNLASPSPTNPTRYVNRPIPRGTPVVDPLGPGVVQAAVGSQRRRDLQRR